MFTVRDLNRRLAEVLRVCDQLGTVGIRSRKGKTYFLQAGPPKSSGATIPDLAARRKRLCPKPLSARQTTELFQWLRGD